MNADEFRKQAAELKGGETMVYFSGHLGEAGERSRDIFELGRVAWHYATDIHFGTLTQRRNGDRFDYLFTRSKDKTKPRRDGRIDNEGT
jgi:hypothetical protein